MKQVKKIALVATAAAIMIVGAIARTRSVSADDGSGQGGRQIDERLNAELRRVGFTGRIESTLEQRLGRQTSQDLADLGRLLFFDTAGGLHDDNACAGCHAPAAGMGDMQSIAIGVQNNGIVGPDRAGPRNQRRSPTVINTAFYPKLMWNGRFFAPSGDPFSNALGFTFPAPEGVTAFPPNHPAITHLLVAQAHIPPTELVEVAGFTGTQGTIGPRFDQFDDGKGGLVPPADASGFRNEPIRQAVLERLNATPEYRELFGRLFPAIRDGAPIDFIMFGRAIAEFEFTLVRANAPIDRYAQGELNALSESEKRGALVFFGEGNCAACHSVAGPSNEMFSDFKMHNIGVPQIAPAFGAGRGNVIFDGPGENEDFGLEQVTGNRADRYTFRSSPLRNVALQPAFFHNGAYTRLEDAIRHHLDVPESVESYNPAVAGVDRDLSYSLRTMDSVLATLDPLLARRTQLGGREFEDLVAFVRNALLDPKATPAFLCRLIPESVPSGQPMLFFQGCSL